MPDHFLIVPRRGESRVVRAPFATVAREVGVPLRVVQPWTEWAAVDGDVSVIRLRGGSAVSRAA